MCVCVGFNLGITLKIYSYTNGITTSPYVNITKTSINFLSLNGK